MPKIVPKAPAFATTEHRNNIASVHSDGEDPVANSNRYDNVEDAASTTTGGTGTGIGVVAQHGSGSEHAAASNNSGEEPDAEADDTDDSGEELDAEADDTDELDTQPRQANDNTAVIKCTIRGCKIRQAAVPLETCCGGDCTRTVHYQCYIHCVQKRSKGKIPDPEGDMVGLGFCTQKCYHKYITADEKGENWHNDGAKGKNDPECSENLLVNMFLSSEEAYSRYRNPYPKRKKDICNEWAKAINKKGVTKIRKGKDVQNKIESIENQMKLAQDFADSDTGQGLQESDPDSFDAAILLRCKFYFELRDIFIKRAGMKPLATTETMLRHSDDEDDYDDDDDGDNMFGNNHDDGFSSSDDGNSNNDCKNDVSCSGSNGDNAALDLTGDDSNDDEDVVIVDESTKSRKAKNSDCSSGTTPQQKKGGKDKEVAKATRKKGSDKKTTKRGSKKETTDQLLHALIEEKLAEKKMKRQKLEGEKKRKKFEDYDLTDYDQFIEFSTKYKKIKENLGSGVQAALQFPEFERLLSPAEKSELHDQRMV